MASAHTGMDWAKAAEPEGGLADRPGATGSRAIGWGALVAFLTAAASCLWIFRLGFVSPDLGAAANGARVLASAAAGMALGAASALRGEVEAWRFEGRLFAVSSASASGLAFGLIGLGHPVGSILLAIAAGALGYGVIRRLESPSGWARAAWGVMLLVFFFAGIPAFMGGATVREGMGGLASFLLGDVSGAHGAGAVGAFVCVAIAVGTASRARLGGRLGWSAFLRGAAFGIAGPVAFVGGAGSALARFASPDGARVSPLAAALFGGALLIAAETAGRMAIGGYAPPLNLTLAFLAIPIMLVARGRARASHRSRRAWLIDGFEWVLAGLVGLALLALGAAVTDFVRIAT